MGLIRKEKKMLTVIRSSYLDLEIIDDAALKCEECGVCFVYSDKSKLEENAVVRDVRSFGQKTATDNQIDFRTAYLVWIHWIGVFLISGYLSYARNLEDYYDT